MGFFDISIKLHFINLGSRIWRYFLEGSLTVQRITDIVMLRRVNGYEFKNITQLVFLKFYEELYH